MTEATAAAYSAAAAMWANGPMRVYGPLAEELVGRCPVDLRGRTVLDLGAGTGAASSAVRGAQVIAIDSAIGMLLERRLLRPPATVGDALALPFRSDAFDVVIAAFSFNHVVDVPSGMREAGRVARAYVMASTFAADDDHPVRHAVDRALNEAGWSSPAWYRESIASKAALESVDAATAAIERGGLVPERVEPARVPFPDLGPRDLVRWRLGMAHCAAFVASHDQRAIETRALELLGDTEPLVRSVIFSVARVS